MVLAQQARINALGQGAVLIQRCSKLFYGTQNRDSRNCKSQILIFSKQILRPR